MKSLFPYCWLWCLLIVSTLSLQACEAKQETSNHFEICVEEQMEHLQFAHLTQEQGIWISPDNEAWLIPQFNIRYQDLFVQNQDTLSGYYVHPNLVSVIEAVLEICHEKMDAFSVPRLKFNSIVRSRSYNRRVGGVPNSEHLAPLGQAADIRFAYDRRNRYLINHFKSEVLKEGKHFERLFDAGCRSFGFYPWGIHFGVRKRLHGWRKFKGEAYAVWDKR